MFTGPISRTGVVYDFLWYHSLLGEFCTSFFASGLKPQFGHFPDYFDRLFVQCSIWRLFLETQMRWFTRNICLHIRLSAQLFHFLYPILSDTQRFVTAIISRRIVLRSTRIFFFTSHVGCILEGNEGSTGAKWYVQIASSGAVCLLWSEYTHYGWNTNRARKN